MIAPLFDVFCSSCFPLLCLLALAAACWRCSPAVTSFALAQRDELVDYLRHELREGDVVLLKGSRSLRMEEMVEQLS